VHPAAGVGRSVSVLHAVPVDVDVDTNGEELLSDLAPGTLTDPVTRVAGTYDLAIYPAGSDPKAAQPAAKADDVQVPAGADATVVAHLSESGSPTLTPFVNDTSPVPAGQARVTVRHVAVDLRAPTLAQGYYEIWLLEPDAVRMVPVGVVRSGDTVLPLPDDLDLATYPVVDVSVEHMDGDRAHSGLGVARGSRTR